MGNKPGRQLQWGVPLCNQDEPIRLALQAKVIHSPARLPAWALRLSCQVLDTKQGTPVLKSNVSCIAVDNDPETKQLEWAMGLVLINLHDLNTSWF